MIHTGMEGLVAGRACVVTKVDEDSCAITVSHNRFVIFWWRLKGWFK